MDLEAMERESAPTNYAGEDDRDIATAIAIYSTKVAAASSDAEQPLAQTLAAMLRDLLAEHAMTALAVANKNNKMRTTSAGDDEVSDDASEFTAEDEAFDLADKSVLYSPFDSFSAQAAPPASPYPPVSTTPVSIPWLDERMSRGLGQLGTTPKWEDYDTGTELGPTGLTARFDETPQVRLTMCHVGDLFKDKHVREPCKCRSCTRDLFMRAVWCARYSQL